MSDDASVTLYESSQEIYDASTRGDGLRSRKINFDPNREGEWQTITVDPNTVHQEIIGFGGAFTDAATFNIGLMTPDEQEEILAAYYGPTGNNYSIGRVPIGSCDFSIEPYSYCSKVDDFDLASFALNEKWDVETRIPIIKRANELRGKPLQLFASPWTAPPWMKDNNNFISGALKKDDRYHKAWALYFSKYLSAYASNGLPFWAVTVQNEPTAPGPPVINWETMRFTAEQEQAFIADHLGPQLAETHPDVNIIMLDDQKSLLPGWAESVLKGSAVKYVKGIGVHWYGPFGPIDEFEKLAATSKAFPDHFLLATEACQGFEPLQHGPSFSEPARWERGESYAHDICGDINSGVCGWTDWNIVLNRMGGPNHAGNYLTASAANRRH